MAYAGLADAYLLLAVNRVQSPLRFADLLRRVNLN
jgi:hypothetical protein